MANKEIEWLLGANSCGKIEALRNNLDDSSWNTVGLNADAIKFMSTKETREIATFLNSNDGHGSDIDFNCLQG